MKRTIFPEREDFLSIWPHSFLSLLLSPSETLKKSQAFNRHSWEHMSYQAYGAVVTETIGPCPPETCSVVVAKINQGDHDSVFQVKWCAKLLNFCPLLFLVWSPTFLAQYPRPVTYQIPSFAWGRTLMPDCYGYNLGPPPTCYITLGTLPNLWPWWVCH